MTVACNEEGEYPFFNENENDKIPNNIIFTSSIISKLFLSY